MHDPFVSADKTLLQQLKKDNREQISRRNSIQSEIDETKEESNMTAESLLGQLKPLLLSAKKLLLEEYLKVKDVMKPANLREAIVRVTKSLTLIEAYEPMPDKPIIC